MYLKITVFLSGFCVMAAEMAAPRLLAPAFGSTQLVWTNIIGTVLASLTLGAFMGGRLADRWPTERAYARVLAAAGASLALVPFGSQPLLESAKMALVEQEVAPFFLALGLVSLLFAPPVLLLGMVSPWAIRLEGFGRADLGRVAGVLGGLAASGSILGTFVASLVALPIFGTRRTLLGVASILVVAGAARGWGRGIRALFMGLGAAVAVVPTAPVNFDAGQVFEAESFYQYIRVTVDDRGWTRLMLNEGLGAQSVKPPTGSVTGTAFDFMAALPGMATRRGDALRVAILGLAGGTLAAQIEDLYGGTRRLHIDGVEIDPDVIAVAQRFFGLREVNGLAVHVTDGRTFLDSAPGTYDVIVADAYKGFYVPPSMATVEFYEAVRSRLMPHGIFCVNLATPPDAGALLDSFAATLGLAFPHVARIEVAQQDAPFSNFLFLASRASLAPPRVADLPAEIAVPVVRGMRATWVVPRPPPGARVLTDDRAPVEQLTDRVLLGILAR